MRARLIIPIVVAIILLLNSVPSYCEEPLVERKPVSRGRAIAMSALFPGLGQLAMERQIRGGGLLVSEALSLVVAFAAKTNYDTELDKYNLTKFEYEALRYGGEYYEADRKWSDLKDLADELDKWDNTKRVSLAIAGGVYLYNLIDIVFLTSGRSEMTSDIGRTEIKLQPVNRCLGLTLSRSF